MRSIAVDRIDPPTSVAKAAPIPWSVRTRNTCTCCPNVTLVLPGKNRSTTVMDRCEKWRGYQAVCLNAFVRGRRTHPSSH
jgi:hypothetical protein